MYRIHTLDSKSSLKKLTGEQASSELSFSALEQTGDKENLDPNSSIKTKISQ